MRLLIDTNIFLEIILQQEKADDAAALLRKAGEHEFFISDYSLHSIGLLLFRRRLHDIFRKFLSDIRVNAGVTLVSISMDDMEAVVNAAMMYNLDFDDAYQYAVAEKHGLGLVSFDSDFDRTRRGRKAPSEI
ncbi:MAG: type II toxin-antitoxin system VapC family toxin [Deltaproteobacteria bacterium]|nr:type II toxin-antitoxin system VapC family toxin [Deltaproteobacteria bacterium]